MKKLIAAASAAACLFTATLAWAGEQDFIIHNRTGFTVVTLQVSESGDDEWGPDILGMDVLETGESAEITFDRSEDACLWDIRVTYDDGDESDWRQVNLCETAEITLS